jgi:carboxyl-terminal processing protease
MSNSTKVFAIALSIAIVAMAFGAGFFIGSSTPPTYTEHLDVVDEAWNVIFSNYVDRDKVDPTNLTRGAIEGMVEELDDPYTSYIDQENYKLGVTRLEGEFEGIGAHITVRDDRLTIIAPIPDSPAEEAGILPGDVILEVDGEPTSELSLAEAVMRIRGDKGTPVTLLVLHEGEEEPAEITIIRASIRVTSVRYVMKDGYAHINLTQFSEHTDEELISVLQTVEEEGARGIVLDLRNNPGGLLEEVVDIASHFLAGDTPVVSVSDGQEVLYVLKANSGVDTTDLPMVVLVNENSASGSEVLSGALQDHERAIVAGNVTFGKGSVNMLYRLMDGSGLYVTTARWLTPDGRLIEGKGIGPDILLEQQGDEAVQWAIDYLRNH